MVRRSKRFRQKRANNIRWDTVGGSSRYEGMVFQFCVENPSTGALRAQPFMQEMMRYSTTVDYCMPVHVSDRRWRVGKVRVQKANSPLHECPRRCRDKQEVQLRGEEARVLTNWGQGEGEERHTYGQGKKLPLPSKHAVPTELQVEVLRRAQAVNHDATWVLDLFSGTQSLKVAASLFMNLKYVGVDIEKKVRVGCVDRVGSAGSTTNGTSRFVETDIVKDLQESDVRQVIKEASLLAGESEDKLLLVWAHRHHVRRSVSVKRFLNQKRGIEITASLIDQR